MTELRRLWSFATPQRAALLAGLALMLAESAAALGVPWLGGRFAATLLGPAPESILDDLALVLMALLWLFAVQAVARIGSGYLLGHAIQRLSAGLKVRLYDHLQALPLSFFQQRRHGDTLALLTHDVYVVSGYAGATLLAVVPMLLVVMGAAFAMLRIDARLAIMAILMIPLFYVALKVLGRRLRPLAAQLREEDALAVAIAEENLGMLPAIKTFTREGAESGRFATQVERASLTADRQLRASVWLGPLLQFVASAAVIAVLWLAGSRVAKGGLTAESLVAFLLYGQLMLRPVAGLANLYGQTQTARASLTRLVGALDEGPEEQRSGAATLPTVRGAIAFEDVTFAYPGRPPVFVHFDLSIAAGETIAFVGPNGAGKSTLVHLLLRLYPLDAGRVTIDGVDIASVSLASLRAQIGLVPQHVLLFNASVRDNIAYGRPDPSDAEIEAAARAARAHDFIMALLKDPPILVLDEATAMFDPEGEADFLAECADALRARTVILITHRSASLAIADRVQKIG